MLKCYRVEGAGGWDAIAGFSGVVLGLKNASGYRLSKLLRIDKKNIKKEM